MLSFRCEQCGKETQLLNIKEASAIVETTRRTIERWIAKGKVHVMEAAGGRTLVCKQSLIRPKIRPATDDPQQSSHLQP
jgi:hypothetical protein